MAGLCLAPLANSGGIQVTNRSYKRSPARDWLELTCTSSADVDQSAVGSDLGRAFFTWGFPLQR